MGDMDGRSAARAAFLATTGVSAGTMAFMGWTIYVAVAPHVAAFHALLAG